MIDKRKITDWLNKYNQIDVTNYINYLISINSQKNIWIDSIKEEKHIDNFKKVFETWLVFDWKHVTIQSNWINYDYIAYKNLMLLKYPESIIDMQLVYHNDEIIFWKESWKISYTHKIVDPFSRTEKDLKWGYCVIKNKRGEFLTILNSNDIEKHRKIAKTDFIWKARFYEMCLKTIIKKAVKIHFDDIYSSIIEEDNKENDLEKAIDLSWIEEIDNINNLEELRKYYKLNEWKWKDFAKYIIKKSEILKSNLKKDENI